MVKMNIISGRLTIQDKRSQFISVLAIYYASTQVPKMTLRNFTERKLLHFLLYIVENECIKSPDSAGL